MREAVLAAVPQPPLAGRDRLPLLHRASRRPHAPDAARDGPVARARSGGPARARRARARGCSRCSTSSASPRGRRSTTGVVGRGRARARRPPPTRCSSTTCSARPTRPCGSPSSPRRSRATGWPTSATRSPESSREPPWSPAVAAFVDEAAGDDRVAREQYFDLLVMRRFRQLAGLPRRPRARAAGRPGGGAAAAGRGRRRRARARGDARGARRDGPGAVRDVARAARRSGPTSWPRRWSRRFDAGAIAFHAVPSPAAAGGRLASAGERARAQPGGAGRDGDDAAQPGRADHRRADGRAAAAARRHARPRGDPRGVPGCARRCRRSTPRWRSSRSSGCCSRLSAANVNCALGRGGFGGVVRVRG